MHVEKPLADVVGALTDVGVSEDADPCARIYALAELKAEAEADAARLRAERNDARSILASAGIDLTAELRPFRALAECICDLAEERDAALLGLKAARIKAELWETCLAALDEVFQIDSTRPAPILPQFCAPGESKIEAIKKLAHAYLDAIAQRDAPMERLVEFRPTCPTRPSGPTLRLVAELPCHILREAAAPHPHNPERWEESDASE